MGESASLRVCPYEEYHLNLRNVVLLLSVQSRFLICVLADPCDWIYKTGRWLEDIVSLIVVFYSSLQSAIRLKAHRWLVVLDSSIRNTKIRSVRVTKIVKKNYREILTSCWLISVCFKFEVWVVAVFRTTSKQTATKNWIIMILDENKRDFILSCLFASLRLAI